MDHLRLVALDAEDLQVISAHVQDAVLRVGDMVFLPRENRFAMVLNRFNWEKALEGRERKVHQVFERRRAGLHFDRVLAVRSQHLDRTAKDNALELLAVHFTETDVPAGTISLVFAGGGEIQLDVECIEAQLQDLDAAWETVRMPEHPAGDGAQPKSS